MNDLVSIIMPTYNRANLIERAIDSILNQTYSNIELIIVDDCSTDETKEIIGKYSDERLLYFKLLKNSGANAARNLGIQKSRGEFITFQDSDDVSMLDRIEKEVKYIKRKRCDWVFCSFCSVLKNDKIKKQKIIIEDDSDIYQKLLNGNFITTQAVLCKKEILEKIKFDDTLPRFQDWDLFIRISKEFNGSYLNEILVKMFPQEDSISANNSKGILALKEIVKKYQDNFNQSQKARIYCRIALFEMLDSNKKNANIYFKKALSIKKDFMCLLLFVLFKINILKVLYPKIKK
ncbi:glycosyltransferase family 2 protein [[Eubacterium] hominis]|uniref:glycosyltransferase family 2 protein n=1 Tax=[Eubacterium] hominis TaxID=2764325 RepID=UPI003A4DE4E9